MLKTAVTCLVSLTLYCKASYYFVAQNTQGCELYSGKVNHNLSKGEAKINFYAPDGSICSGQSKVTYIPSLYTTGCKGQRGIIWGSCTDGKRINGSWHTATCTTGYGTAHDNFNNTYEFTFGETAKEAVQKVNILRSQLNCPAININGTRLEVQGKILRTD